MSVEATEYLDLVPRFTRLVARETEGVKVAAEPCISAQHLEVRLREACSHAIDALLRHGNIDRIVLR